MQNARGGHVNLFCRQCECYFQGALNEFALYLNARRAERYKSFADRRALLSSLNIPIMREKITGTVYRKIVRAGDGPILHFESFSAANSPRSRQNFARFVRKGIKGSNALQGSPSALTSPLSGDNRITYIRPLSILKSPHRHVKIKV